MIKYDYSRAIALREAEAKAATLGLRGGGRQKRDLYQDRLEWLDADDRARETHRAEKARRLAETQAPLEEVTGAELAEDDDLDVEYRVDGLWVVGGNIVCRAVNKAGKSTLTDNLVHALTTGADFLGAFPVKPVGSVYVIDSERPKSTIRQRWLALGIREGVTLNPIRGQEARLNMADPITRADWVRRLSGHDVLILDCLGPVIRGLGLDENRDASAWLIALRGVCEEAGVSEIVVVHHMGHEGTHGRGDSGIDGFGDDLWALTVKGNAESARSPRSFRAGGRNTALDPTRLVLDPKTWRLTLGDGPVPDDEGVNEAGPLKVSLAPYNLDHRRAMYVILAVLAPDAGMTQAEVYTRFREITGNTDKATADGAWKEAREARAIFGVRKYKAHGETTPTRQNGADLDHEWWQEEDVQRAVGYLQKFYKTTARPVPKPGSTDEMNF
ncbi:AAA family ATPase [Dietzia maris]